MTVLEAMAHEEGFYKPGDRPARNNNPLDLEFEPWVSAADTGSYVICNPTASPITGSAISFIVAAK